MIKKVLLSCLVVLLFVSCATSNYVNSNPVVVSPRMSVEEKFEKLGFQKSEVYSTKVFFDGQEWSDTLRQLIDESQSYILLTAFLASECEENEDIFNALIEKAESGVEVYLVYDSLSYNDYTETKNHLRQIAFLRDYGVHIHEFNPLSVPRLLNPVGMLLREHRKICVFDGNTVALGGMNLSYISGISTEKGGQRDSMYCMESDGLASALKKDFVDFWNSISYEEIDIDELKDIEKSHEGESVSCWVADQYLGSTVMPEVIASLFYSAKKEIRILPLYSIPDDGMYTWVKDAAVRGVDIEMLLPNDHMRPGQRASLFAEKKFMENGLRIRHENDNEKSSNLLHEKLFVFDSRYIVAGSVNFNHRSMMLSQEVAVVIDNPELASFLVEHYEEFCENSYVVTPEMAQKNNNILNAIFFPILYFGG